MELSITKLADVGFFFIPFAPRENPWLFALVRITLLLSFFLESLLLRKGSKGRWWFLGIAAAGAAFGAVTCQIITGWDLILYMVIYGFFLTMLLGIGLALLFRRIRNKS